jgi:exosome complex RNA-binding protein Rrp42 (RNase PH superfamily)
MFDSDATVLKVTNPQGYLNLHLDEGVRFDGRRETESRATVDQEAVSANPNVFGSAMVHLVPMGDKNGAGTKCVCNISVQIGRPSLEHPDDGDLSFDVTLSPALCARYDTDYANRRKHDDAIDLEAFLKDLWSPSVCNAEPVIDLSQLGIETGRTAFRLVVSILFLSLDGNMQDCAVRAVNAALHNTMVPKAVSGGADGQSLHVTRKDNSALQVNTELISRTFAIVSRAGGKRLFLKDPTKAEEALVRSTITVVSDRNSKIRGVFVDAVENCCGKGVKETGLSLVDLHELLAQK